MKILKHFYDDGTIKRIAELDGDKILNLRAFNFAGQEEGVELDRYEVVVDKESGEKIVAVKKEQFELKKEIAVRSVTDEFFYTTGQYSHTFCK